MTWLPILCLWVGALLGFMMHVFIVGCREAAPSREDDLLIKLMRREAVNDLLMQMEQHPVSMEDLCILAGSEGENLPRLDIRREVAEQMGCEEAEHGQD